VSDAAVELEESPEDIWGGEEPETEETPPDESGEPAPPPGAPKDAAEPGEEAGAAPAEEPEETPEEPLADEAAQKSSPELRKEMQDYLAKVRDKLESDRRSPEREGEQEQLKAPGLLDYLGKLANHLPNGVKSRFQESDERLRMEVLKSKLFGRRGLRKRASTHEPAGKPAGPVHLTARKIADTFSYMKDLAVYIRDTGLRKNMMGKLESLLGKLGRPGVKKA
jgi:hypothetical protein